PARQEGDARHRRWDVTLETPERRFGDLGRRRALGGFLTRDHHVGLQHHAFEKDAVFKELTEHGIEYGIGHVLAPRQRVVAVHQDFGFDDRGNVRFLAQCRVAGERVRIGVDGETRRYPCTDVYHGTPLRETCTELVILREPLAQPV